MTINAEIEKMTISIEHKRDLIVFYNSYVKTALWSSTAEDEDDGYTPLDRHYYPDDIASATQIEMLLDCYSFLFSHPEDEVTQALGQLPRAELGKVAHKFWLNRNGHGAGFWDSEWDINGKDYSADLSARSKKYGTYDLYVGDDDHVYGA
jgi:hypothetical protein